MTTDTGAWVYYKLTCEPLAQVSSKQTLPHRLICWLVDLMFHLQLRSYGDVTMIIVSSDRLEKPGIEPAIPGL